MSLPHAWSVVAGGVRLQVRVTPRGGRDGVDGVALDADERPHLNIRVAAAPVDGETNDAVEKLLAKWLGVAKDKVEVVAGETVRTKTVMVDGDPVQIVRRCQALIAPKAKA